MISLCSLGSAKTVLGFSKEMELTPFKGRNSVALVTCGAAGSNSNEIALANSLLTE